MEEYTNEMKDYKITFYSLEDQQLFLKNLHDSGADYEATPYYPNSTTGEYDVIFTLNKKKSPNSKRFELEQRKTEALEAIAKLTHQEKVDYICKGMDPNEAINQDDLRRIVKEEIDKHNEGVDFYKSYSDNIVDAINK